MATNTGQWIKGHNDQQSQIDQLRDDLAEFKNGQSEFNDAVESRLPDLEPVSTKPADATT